MLVPPVIAGKLEAGRKASNLAFALHVLSAQRRRDAIVFYRFCRTLDDIADSSNLSLTERSSTLDAWQKALEKPGQAPADLEKVIEHYAIDRALLREILAGVRADLTIHRYTTFDEVRQYCWRVASAVGLVSIRIFGCTHHESEAYAESLGLALQWTNILRDVGEDAANGRIYLPLEELDRFGVTVDELLSCASSDRFHRLMEFQAQRAEAFFADARSSRHPSDRQALAPAEIMRTMYERLLMRMRTDNFRVLQCRYRLSRLEKLWLAATTLLFR